MTTPDATVLVLHDLGDPSGGAPWRNAFARAGWPGPVIAPDLPGHAGTPSPIGGHHDLADPAFFVAMLDLAAPVDVVVGIGASGWAAQLVGLGGRARAVALVDGTGAPWRHPRQQLLLQRERVQALARLAVEPAGGGPDALAPAVAHPPPRHGSRRLAGRALSMLDLPLLVVEPARFGLDDDALDDLLLGVTSRATVRRVDALSAAEVAAVITRWSMSTDQAP
jgi:hypothetical protein